jgi:hypothetical protein
MLPTAGEGSDIRQAREDASFKAVQPKSDVSGAHAS